MKGMEVFCVNCWKRTELEEQDPEVLPTYNPVLVLSSSISSIKNSINGGNNVPTVNHEGIPPDKDKKVCLLYTLLISIRFSLYYSGGFPFYFFKLEQIFQGRICTLDGGIVN